MAGQNIPYAGYPGPGVTAIRNEWAGDHFGPGVTQGNYQANGYNMSAQSFGMSRIETVGASAWAQSNNFYVVVRYPASSANTETSAVGFNSVNIRWYAANNNEVANNTNLNAEVVQLRAYGL